MPNNAEQLEQHNSNNGEDAHPLHMHDTAAGQIAGGNHATVPTVVVHVEGDGVPVVYHQRQGCSPAVQTWIVLIVVKVQSGRGPIRIGEITAAEE